MKDFFRILKYILNYRTLVVLALFCSVVYASMNAFSVYLIGPFLEKIFVQEKIVEKNVSRPEEVDNLKRLKLYINEKVDDFLGGGTHRQVLSRLCLLVIIVILFKNIFSYLLGYIMAYVEQGVIRNLREDIYAAYHRLPLRYFQ